MDISQMPQLHLLYESYRFRGYTFFIIYLHLINESILNYLPI
jgi:hypothetical protein